MIPPEIRIADSVSTITSAAVSKRSRVVTAKGRKIAKTIVFHTQSHLKAAASGNSAPRSVNHAQTSRKTMIAWRKVKVSFVLRSISSQPPKAATKAISDSGRPVIGP